MAGWNDPNILSKMKLPAGAGAANYLKPVAAAPKTSIPGGTAGVPAPAMPVPSGQPQTPTASAGAVPPMPQNTSYYGANTNPGVTPTYGFGGQAYGSLDAAGRTAMVSDENRLRSDKGYLQSEWDRSNNVLASRQGAGMDTRDQLDYLQKLQGYGAGATPPPAQSNPVPTQSNPTPTPSSGVPSPQSSYAMTPDQIQQEAKARIDRLIADKTRVANQTKGSLDTSYNRGVQDMTEQRNLENVTNQRQLSPFSGRSDYAQGMIAMQRGKTDRQMAEDLQTQKGNVDSQLNDFLSAAPEQQQQIINELSRIERDYGLQLGQLTGTIGGQQTLAARTADQNYQLGLGGLTGNIGGTRTVQGQQLDWNMNSNNPNNQGQVLQNQGQAITNQINQLKLQNLPQEMKSNLDILDQQVKTGAIGLQEANYKLKEMTDPNSVTNQAKAIDLELGKINLANAPQEAKLKIQQLQKQIAEIGKAPYRSQEQIDMDKVKLDSAREELKQLQGGTKSTEINTFVDNLRQIYTAKDPTSGVIKVTNSQALRSAIIAKGLPDDKTDELLLMFGLPTN